MYLNSIKSLEEIHESILSRSGWKKGIDNRLNLY